jgi:hypothetical protein
MEVDEPGPEEDENHDPDTRVTDEDTGRKEHAAELAA